MLEKKDEKCEKNSQVKFVRTYPLMNEYTFFSLGW